MASQVLSGAANASYTNNTGQNVRIIINYMANVTSMSWAGVSVTASSTTIGKDIQNITGEFRSAVTGRLINSRIVTEGRQAEYTYELKLGDKKTSLTEVLVSGTTPTPKNANGTYSNPLDSFNATPTNLIPTQELNPINDNVSFRPYIFGARGNSTEFRVGQSGANIFYVPLTVSRGGSFPVELMLAPNQSFSATCGAFNAIVIKEDGT